MKMEKIVLMRSNVDISMKDFLYRLDEKEKILEGYEHEIQRWDISEEKEAREELKKYSCYYSQANWNNVVGEEYALVFCDCDEEGEVVDEWEYVMAEIETHYSLDCAMALREDGNSYDDIIKHLRYGSATAFDVESLMDYLIGCKFEEEEIEEFREMIRTGVPVADWSVAEYNNQTFYIQYEL